MDRVHDLIREATAALADLPDPFLLTVSGDRWCATYTGDGDEIDIVGRHGRPQYEVSMGRTVMAEWRVGRGQIVADVHGEDRWLAALTEVDADETAEAVAS